MDRIDVLDHGFVRLVEAGMVEFYAKRRVRVTAAGMTFEPKAR